MIIKHYERLKSHMEQPLIIDGTRCELIKQNYRPFILGGDVTPTIQCPNRATVKIISHAEHEKDVSPMFLCDECLILFKRDNAKNLLDYEIVELQKPGELK
jgi:hypothetical protein